MYSGGAIKNVIKELDSKYPIYTVYLERDHQVHLSFNTPDHDEINYSHDNGFINVTVDGEYHTITDGYNEMLNGDGHIDTDSLKSLFDLYMEYKS